MKRKTQAAALLITGTLIAASLAGCAARTSPEGSTDKENALPTEKDLISTYTAQIEHYEALISTLEADLLKEKEESYITAAEYEQKIKELEASIQALTDKSTATDTPPSETVSGNGSNQVGTQTETDNDRKPPSNLSTTTLTTNEIDGKLTVSGYFGDEAELSIPSQIDGIGVVAIGESAFANSSITKLTLPDTVAEIDWFAFSGCHRLAEIVIPSSVTLIGYGAFDGCSPDLTIICEKDSYAERYAQSWGISYKYE